MHGYGTMTQRFESGESNKVELRRYEMGEKAGVVEYDVTSWLQFMADIEADFLRALPDLREWRSKGSQRHPS